MKLLLINVAANSGSTGIIAEGIGIQAQQAGYEVAFAYGRKAVNSKLALWQIGKKPDYLWHGVESRIWDNHGFASRSATRDLIKRIEQWQPDIVNIHNVHGYYINVDILFSYLKEKKIPVVWTFHDCWPFNGHCTYFERFGCFKWETECHHCPAQREYPASWIFDRSKTNFGIKKALFNGIGNMTIVTPSVWLADYVSRSFLKNYPVQVINNGIDLRCFTQLRRYEVTEKYSIGDKKIVLGVASVWSFRKGLDDFLQLRSLLSENIQIVLVGLDDRQINRLPEGIKGIARTENREELAAIYGVADVYVNPTYMDNFPTVNIEALACGTPVVTYRTGGSPEAVDTHTGIVVDKGDIAGLHHAVLAVLNHGKNFYSDHCRKRAEQLYNADDRFTDYVTLFDRMLKRN